MYSLMEEVIDSLKKKNRRMLVRIISVSPKFFKEDLKICRSSVIILTRYPVIRCDSSLKKILINSGIPPNFAWQDFQIFVLASGPSQTDSFHSNGVNRRMIFEMGRSSLVLISACFVFFPCIVFLNNLSNARRIAA